MGGTIFTANHGYRLPRSNRQQYRDHHRRNKGHMPSEGQAGWHYLRSNQYQGGTHYRGRRLRRNARSVPWIFGHSTLTIQLDIGFEDVIVPAPVLIEYPTILDLPSPELYGYSKESTIAEKFEVMVKLGALNSRMKDFFDIWLLSWQFDFESQRLAAAIEKTFSTRGTDIQSEPIALTNSFAEDPSKVAQWQGFISKNRLTNVPQDFGEVIKAIEFFLGPVTKTLAVENPLEAVWRAPGPWSR
ncbi:MAG: nucleotidyl transferase AbiEii/AbiGii toxin family protein [Thermodesulfobacteriota bacterium]|nr:nucleotidyl transferase AbiEii/AbiGii toxin family protein [Thermodesulfobacteriota bacterium]